VISHKGEWRYLLRNEVHTRLAKLPVCSRYSVVGTYIGVSHVTEKGSDVAPRV
jgi:hypothetical protein